MRIIQYVMIGIFLSMVVQVCVGSTVQYTGKPLSLNFQEIELRSALQILAEFTGLNMIASDEVTGSLTLRLDNVPWDQALDMILESKGLSQKREGNVILIGPASYLAKQSEACIEAKKQAAALLPLVSKTFRLKYADAHTIFKLLKNGQNVFLSTRGSATFDRRTNILLVQATEENLKAIDKLIRTLDVPVRQVMIEARIVQTSCDFSKALGIKWGVTSPKVAKRGIQLKGRGLCFDGGISAPTSVIGLSFAHLPADILLDLELQALETENKIKIVAQPKL